MKRFLILLCVILSDFLGAQHYKPIPLNSDHYWTQTSVGWVGPAIVCTSLDKYKIKDTLVVSTNYKKVYLDVSPPQNLGCGITPKNFLLRQDSIQRKVFVLINNQERILYNFNKVMGDTLKVWDISLSPPLGGQITTTVVAIDSVLLLDNKYHKRFRYNVGGWNYAIEGVGGEKGLLTPYFSVFETDINMICMGVTNSTLSTIYMNPSYANVGCTPNIMGLKAHKSNSRINLFPNPVTEQLHITMNESTDATYELMDTLGNKIPLIKMDTKSSSELSFNLSALPKGIYFIRVHENNGEMFIEKIIKE